MAEIRCWRCGVEPIEVRDISTFVDREPRYMPVRWPPGDLPHAEVPPTPTDADLARIVEEWTVSDG